MRPWERTCEWQKSNATDASRSHGNERTHSIEAAAHLGMQIQTQPFPE